MFGRTRPAVGLAWNPGLSEVLGGYKHRSALRGTSRGGLAGVPNALKYEVQKKSRQNQSALRRICTSFLGLSGLRRLLVVLQCLLHVSHQAQLGVLVGSSESV